MECVIARAHRALAIRVPPALYFVLCLRRGTFCQQRQKVPKERRQNQGFGILCAGRVQLSPQPVSHANGVLQNPFRAFAWPLRLQPLAADAGPRWSGAAGMAAASTVRRDVGIAPYENFGGYAFVGDDAHIVPAAPTSMLSVGAGLCPACGRPRGSPLRRFCRVGICTKRDRPPGGLFVDTLLGRTTGPASGRLLRSSPTCAGAGR